MVVKGSSKGIRHAGKGVRRYGDGEADIRVGKRTADIILGIEDVTKWTDDELINGHKKNGRPPKLIPKEVHQELMRRFITNTQHRFYAEMKVAMDKLFAVINSIPTKTNSKGDMVLLREMTPLELDAIKIVLERTMGRPKQEIDVNIGVKPPWQEAMEVSIAPNAEIAAQMEEAAKEFAANERARKAITVKSVKPDDEEDE